MLLLQVKGIVVKFLNFLPKNCLVHAREIEKREKIPNFLNKMSNIIFHPIHPVKKSEKMTWGSPWGCANGGKWPKMEFSGKWQKMAGQWGGNSLE